MNLYKMFSYWNFKILIIIHLFNNFIGGQTSFHNQVNERILKNSFDFLENLNHYYKLNNYGEAEIPEDIRTHVYNRVRRWTSSQPIIVRNNLSNTSARKHHFSKQTKEAYKLNRLEGLNFLTLKEVSYIHLFLHRSVDQVENLFSACLLNDGSGHSSRLVLYELSEQGSWKFFVEMKIENGVKILTQTVPTGTLIIAVENFGKSTEKHYLASPVFFLNDNNNLKLVQSLNIEKSFDVTTCQFEHTIFLAVTVPNSIDTFDKRDKTSSIIFMWKGSHFDILQHIPLQNAKKLSLFSIKASMFLVVSSNQEISDGDTRAVSEIFKYNAQTNSFLSFQKLPTSGVTDIRHFKFDQGADTQYFMAVANYFDGNSNTRNISVSSVIYKFEDKFVPHQSFFLNRNKQWTPVMIEPDMFVLLAHTNEGVLMFQYNGWKFVPILNHQLLNLEINTNALVYAFVFGNHPIIVIQNNSDGRIAKFYRLHFSIENTLESYETNLLNKCEKSTKNVLANNIEHISKELIGDVKFVGEDLEYLEQSLIKNLDTDELQLNGKTMMDKMQMNRINEASRLISVQTQAIQELLRGLPQLVRKTDLYTMANFQANHIVLRNPTNALPNLNVNNLNTFTYNDVFQSIAFDKSKGIEQQFLIENLEVKDMEYAEMNGVKRADFNRLINHISTTSGVVVKGDVFLDSELTVHGHINRVHISKLSTLTKTGNQELHGTLNVFELTSQVIASPHINDMTFETFRDIIQMSYWTVSAPLAVNKLSVQDVTVRGSFGRNKLEDLFIQSLKLHGSQEISAPFRIKHLESGKFTPKLIDSLRFVSVESDVDLPNIVRLEDAHINRLILKERLNDIEVMDGVLGVLVLNGTNIQVVSGSMVTENVELMRSVTLQGTIKSSIMNKKNPLKMTTTALTLKGNYILKGNVAIENSFTATDIVMRKSKLSIAKISKEALKLLDPIIPVPLMFKKKVTASNINFHKINTKSYASWIIPGADDVIVLSSKKHFSHVKVMGECVAPHTLNGIVLEDFGGRIMRTSGDQEITGNVTFHTLYIRSIQSNHSLVGGVLLNDLVTYGKAQQLRSYLTLEHDAIVLTNLHAGNVIVRGVVSQHALQSLYNDTLFAGRKHAIVKSRKRFTGTMQIKHLINATSLLGTNIEEINSALHWNKNILVKNWVEVDQPVFMKNIHVNGTVEGIKDFGKSWLLFEEDQNLVFEQTMDRVAVQNMHLTTNHINDMNIQEFPSFIRSDRDLSVAKMDVYGELSATKINLAGRINNVKLNDILISTADNQFINFTYSFKGGLQVKSIDFKSLRGLSLETLNSFMSPTNECHQRLFVRGVALFKTEPDIKRIQDIHVSDVLKQVWFLSQDVVLQNFVKIEQLTSTNVLGLQSINHSNMKKLALTYLSKTRHQNVTGRLHVSQITAAHIRAAQVDLDSARLLLLNNGTMQHFIGNILKIEDDQVIEHDVKIQYAEINGSLDIPGLVNGMNFSQDVIQSGNKNEMLGRKVFNNIKIDNLVLGDSAFIDGVQLQDWLDNAVTRNTSDKHIGGVKNMSYSEIAHLSIPSNGTISIPGNVLVQGMEQNVSGVKVFVSNIGRNVNIHFNRLYISNHLNEFQSGSFKYLVNKSDDTVCITSDKVFLDEVIARNIRMDSENHQLLNIVRAEEHIPKLSEKYIEMNRNIKQLVYHVRDSIND